MQILNSEVFRQVTGVEPPETPITAKTYAEHGLPFYKLYNETSAVKGDFKGVKSVKAIDKAKAKASNGKRKHAEHDEPSLNNPVVLLNPDGARKKFCPVSELKEELLRMNGVQFGADSSTKSSTTL